MQAFLKQHRWVILAAGAAIQVLTGVPAAWGVFQRGVCEGYSLSQENAAMIFSLTICFFRHWVYPGRPFTGQKGAAHGRACRRGTAVGGLLRRGLHPGENPWFFYGVFSVPVGLGCAFCILRSCPARRSGMRTARAWPRASSAARWARPARCSRFWAAFSSALEYPHRVLGAGPSDAGGVRRGRGYFGKPGAAAPGNSEAEARRRTGTQRPRDYSVKEMLKTNQYWLMFAVVGLATPAVLLFSPIIVELAQERGLSQTAALACIVVGSVFSAAGRLLMPWLSDKIGRRYTDMLLLAALCGFSVWFIYAGSWWVILVYSLLTFCYSGEAAVIPAAGTDLFGQKNAGINYGFLALGMSVGSVGFPLLARCF